MERMFEPKFRAGADDWDLACDGKALLIRGKGAIGSSKSFHDINSIVPLLAISSFELATGSDGSSIKMSIWDGTAFTLHYDRSDLQPVESSLERLVRHIKARNLAWPLGSARAATARSQIQPGYLRDRKLLGDMGVKEFWSPLADLPWHWAQLVAAQSPFSNWPKAAKKGRNRNADALMVLYQDGLIVTAEDGPRIIASYRQLQAPSLEPGSSIATKPTATTAPNLKSQADSGGYGVMLQMGPPSTGESMPPSEGMTTTGPVFFSTDDQSIQDAYRYILVRWATAQVEGGVSASQALEEAAEQLESGRLAPEAFSVLVDAFIAHEAGVSLSSSYPTEERAYFPKPSVKPPKKPEVNQTKSTPPRQEHNAANTAQNVRRAAVGAAGAAAIFGFMTD